jgi:hypothetical protein
LTVVVTLIGVDGVLVVAFLGLVTIVGFVTGFAIGFGDTLGLVVLLVFGRLGMVI